MAFQRHAATIPARRILATVLVFCLCLLPAQLQSVRAADYNCGAYGAGTYDNGGVCGAATTDDGLVNTGQALAVGVPALMILAGTVLLFRVRKKRHTHDLEVTRQ